MALSRMQFGKGRKKRPKGGSFTQRVEDIDLNLHHEYGPEKVIATTYHPTLLERMRGEKARSSYMLGPADEPGIDHPLPRPPVPFQRDRYDPRP